MDLQRAEGRRVVLRMQIQTLANIRSTDIWDRGTHSLGTILEIKTFKNSQFDPLEKRINVCRIKTNRWALKEMDG